MPALVPPIASTNPTADRYLGPAEVVEAGVTSVVLRLRHDRQVEARIALAFAYQPRPGDRVLAIGEGQDDHYVIGVLHTPTGTSMTFPGDLDLQALGKLRLRGENGIELDGPEVELRAGKLKILAGSVSERFQQLHQRVSELLTVQAGQRHTTIEGTDYRKAKASTLITEEKVTINGKAIHLG